MPQVFGDVLYDVSDPVATNTLNRPQRFNAISKSMPADIADAFGTASNDPAVHAVILIGTGKGFCGGYDLNIYAESTQDIPALQEMPWDPMIDYQFMRQCTEKFMSIWCCDKTVIGNIHGDAVAGGSDIALCCDLVAVL